MEDPKHTPRKYKPHPLAELLPPMTAEEYAELKADLAANGQREPITAIDCRILDGRHRYRACLELGIQPAIVQFDPARGSPIDFVYSGALRRNCTHSQLACSGWRFKQKMQQSGVARGRGRPPKKSEPGSELGNARDFTGTVFGVSGRYIDMAGQLDQQRPDLFAQCFSGDLPVTRARAIMRRESRAERMVAKAAAVAHLPPDCRLVAGDAVAELETFPARHFRLIFADPPYNLRFPYHGDATRDDRPADDYLAWCAAWLESCKRVLARDGTIVVMICEEWLDAYGQILRRLGLTVRRVLVWYERFGQNCANNFNRTCRFLYYCTADAEDFTFNVDALATTAARSKTYADKRAMPGGKVLDAKLDLDALWDIPRVQGTALERSPHRPADDGGGVGRAKAPTQLPLALLNRLVCGLSNPGDRVLDPFGGTFTTGEACALNGRAFVGIDQSPLYVRQGEERIKLALARKGAA